MTLALEWGDSQGEGGVTFVYFDAVQKYTKEYKGKVTEHPIDRKSNVSDHYIRQNPKIHIQGYISGVDLHNKSNLDSAVGARGSHSPDNATPAPRPVSVGSRVDNALPTSLSQYFSTPSPLPDLDRTGQGMELIERVKDAMEKVVGGSSSDIKIPLVTVYEYTGRMITKVERGLCITSLVFEEDPDSGDALYCDMTLEKITFSEESQSAFDEDVVAALQTKAAKKESKGKQDSTEQEPSPEDKWLLKYMSDVVRDTIRGVVDHHTGGR